MEDRKCEYCGKTFTPTHKNAKLCGAECRGKKNTIMFRRWSKNRPEHQRRGRAALADKVRGTGKAPRGYVKRNGRHEHRVVMESVLGRRLRSDEIVHHKDGNTRNNDPANLELMSRREHALEHDLPSMAKSFVKGQEPLFRGQDCPWAKLTNEAIATIKERRTGGATLSRLAKEFGVSETTISRIARGTTWKHLSKTTSI